MSLQSDRTEVLQAVREQLAELANYRPYAGQIMIQPQLDVLFASTAKALGLLCAFAESLNTEAAPSPPVLTCASCDRPDVEKKLLYGLPLRICHTCLEEVVTAVHTSVARTARDRLEWALGHDYPRAVKRADDTK